MIAAPTAACRFPTAGSRSAALPARIMAGSTILKGNCLETPAEPAESNFCQTVKHKAYPVQKFAGLYWAYFGPQPAPVMPKYDVWARTDGWHWLRALPQLDCNWLQAMENSVDTAHLHILHQELVTDGFKVESTTRGTIDNLVKFEVEEFDHGVIKRRVFKDGKVEEHPLLFPTVLRQANRTQIRVPIDDTHTWIVYVHFVPDSAEPHANKDEVPVNYRKPFKNPLGRAPSLHQVSPRRSGCPRFYGMGNPGADARSHARAACRFGSRRGHVSGNAQRAKLRKSRST